MTKIKKQKIKSNIYGRILAVDVGNTNIHFAVMENGTVLFRTSVSSTSITAKLKQDLRDVIKKDARVKAVVICSVVPSVTKVLTDLIFRNMKIVPVVVGSDRKVPLKNLYHDPQQVGQDRLVCAYAACEFYGTPAIIIDLGTAITIDVVSAKREYLGGIIIPGIHITAETLFERTALLPLVKIEKPGSLIGKDTKGSILSGIFYGYGEMLKGLIHKLSRQLKAKPKIIMTGGHAKLMSEYIAGSVNAIDDDLVFKGLSRLYPG